MRVINIEKDFMVTICSLNLRKKQDRDVFYSKLIESSIGEKILDFAENDEEDDYAKVQINFCCAEGLRNPNVEFMHTCTVDLNRLSEEYWEKVRSTML